MTQENNSSSSSSSSSRRSGLLWKRMEMALEGRKEEGSYRSMKSLPEEGVDFSSNDYLGLSRCPKQQRLVFSEAGSEKIAALALGATGSRLLSGQSKQYEDMEEYLAKVHNSHSALLCSSGYVANLCVISCLPYDIVFMDELVHNSMRMATQFPSPRRRRRRPHNKTLYTFAHNDPSSLLQQLQQHHQQQQQHNDDNEDSCILILVESVYSMDGDVAPLQEILDIAKTYHAHVIVDEAHGFGIYGSTNPHHLTYTPSTTTIDNNNNDDEEEVCKEGGGMGVLAALGLERHEALLAAVYTYGKAAGCHGAVIVSNHPSLKPYIVNYARPFMYSTALPPHALITIRCAYQTIRSIDGDRRRNHLFRLVHFFLQQQQQQQQQFNNYSNISTTTKSSSSSSPSPIQAIPCPGGNHQCSKMAHHISQSYTHVYPIRYPTVPKGQERIRIIFHSHNTLSQVQQLLQTIQHAYTTTTTTHQTPSSKL